jgi:hypothetical protein
MILKPLFSEILRPRQLSDLALPQKDIDHLEQMVASRAIMNLLFYGKIGSGKTSAARVILSIVARRASTEIDGSLLTGAECVREHVAPYVSSGCLYGAKICFLDQADLAFNTGAKFPAEARRKFKQLSVHFRGNRSLQMHSRSPVSIGDDLLRRTRF